MDVSIKRMLTSHDPLSLFKADYNNAMYELVPLSLSLKAGTNIRQSGRFILPSATLLFIDPVIFDVSIRNEVV